jgi:hypothetical protein
MKKIYLIIVFFSIQISLLAQDRTVGLIHYDPAVSDGYTLITSHHTTSTYLIDNCGNVVHEWESEFFYGNSVDLLENGLLLRATKTNSVDLANGGAGGRVELLDWDGNIVWEIVYSTSEYRQHHDAVYLPNGNILILAWDARSTEEALQAGLNPEYLGNIKNDIWGEHLIEVKPIGQDEYEIVWEWYLWDHVIQDFDETKDNFGVVEDHPELVDLNYNTDPGNPGWIHANAIDYNEELDQIIINSRNFNEFWIIDHSTTTEEARGHSGGNVGRGGDLLYRYGNPVIYRRGDESDRKFYSQHNTHWIARDKIVSFNNGPGRTPQFSEIFFMETPVQEDGSYLLPEDGMYGPEGPYLTYSSDDIEGFVYSSFISSVELLENGNLLICSGASGMISEITPDGNTLWTYVSPLSSQGTVEQGRDILNTNGISNLMYRSRKYPTDFPGLAGKTLTPQEPLELNPLVSLCEESNEVVSVEDDKSEDILLYPNPVDEILFIRITGTEDATRVTLTTLDGKILKDVKPFGSEIQLHTDDLAQGIYFIQVETGRNIVRRKIVKE